MRTVAVLTLAGLLAGCGKPAPTVRETEATKVAAVSTLTGWDRVFASPQEVIGAINQAGLGIDMPAAADYALSGHERMISNSSAAVPNTINATVKGAEPARIDTITYSLSLTDPVDAKTARRRFAQTIGDFLTRFKLPGFAALLDAARDGQPFAQTVAGAPASVVVVPPANGAPERIDVTFTRPAAISPGNTKTQG
ncbi:DUF6030 family protein [Sphingomonas sp. PB2P19]|uniref:DUF6030 family protein n=1 Tax=Sphingomonas rhamnosi TaxID=3096156 RepID=UPI002FCC9152